jgi:hypothetical protein
VDVNLAEGVSEKRRQALGAVRLRPCSNGCGLGIAVAEGRIVGVRAYFDIPYDRITSSMVEAAPGKPVLLPVRADRFGPSLDKHAAVTAVEYSANVTPELNRKDGTVATRQSTTSCSTSWTLLAALAALPRGRKNRTEKSK